MSDTIVTTCGLDCYDACRIVVREGDANHLQGDASHPFGNGALCAAVNKYMHETPRILKPRIDGKEVRMDEVLEAIAETFKQSKRALLWRGSGNMGVMQEVTNLFMERIGGSLTHGSLCDAAGHAGILLGRGVNRTLPPETIAKAETVVVWGRNLTVTNSHMLPFIEGKKLIVIDPIRTPIAKKADLFLQIEPRMDYDLAIILARFVIMEDSQATEWLETFAPEYEEFYEYTREHRIKAILEHIGTDLGEMGHFLELVRDKKTVFLVGTGVQKYSVGSYTLRAIDSLAAVMGLFGKEGSGVHYLGDSKLGFDNPFAVDTTTVPKATTQFSYFDTVLVQGGNPAESMPDSNRVRSELEKVPNLIYFGLYENETSARARIVLPAKHFLEKEDVRLSYGHHYVGRMRTAVSTDIGISEYDLTAYLFQAFGFEGLQSEEEYIEHWLKQCDDADGCHRSPEHRTLPYKEGFGEDFDEEFEFIDEYDDDFITAKQFWKYRKLNKNKAKEEIYWLITPKSAKSINTQFKRDNRVRLHPQTGYRDGDEVRLVSEYGEQILTVALDEDMRPNCAVVTNNTIGVNKLTPPIVSKEGDNACYQEVRVRIEKMV